LFYLVHCLQDIDLDPQAAGLAAVIYWHTHRAEIRQDGLLYLNPGSAGPRRFDLPVSVAKIEMAAGELHARIITL
jgi:hypothetical protein